jgi:DNA-binding MarR family transcriptional regulator
MYGKMVAVETMTAQRRGAQTTNAPSAANVDPQVVEWASRVRSTVMPLARIMRQAAVGRFSPTQLSVLATINRHGPLSLGDLAARERLSPPSITKVVVVLEDAGVVERLLDPGDRRVCLVRATPEGSAWIEAGRAERDAWLAGRIAGLPGDQRAALVAALPALEGLLGDDA